MQTARQSVVAVQRGGVPVALGTVLDARGYLVSKASEVLPAESPTTDTDAVLLEVVLPSGQVVKARTLAVDGPHDLISLHVLSDPEISRRLQAVRWAQTPDGDAVASARPTAEVGRWVVIPQGPLGLEATMPTADQGLPLAVGIVSAPVREVAGVRLGVALADIDSRRLPGVLVQSLSEAAAEPADPDQLPAEGKLLEDLILPGGVMITGLMKGMGAEEAGLQAGDFLVKIGQQPVHNAAAVIDAIQQVNAGQTVPIEILRLSEPAATAPAADGPDPPKDEIDQDQRPHNPPPVRDPSSPPPTPAQAPDQRVDRSAEAAVVQRLTFEVEMRLRPETERSRADRMNTMGNDRSRRRDGFAAVFQHDALIDPHRCGGPVLNLDGHVIGINIARAGRVEVYALPAVAVRKVWQGWIDDGHVD